MARVSPGRVSARRRWQWPSPEAAWSHFASKSNFARWDERVLHDYVRCGTEPDPAASTPGGVRLSFDREVETRLYHLAHERHEKHVMIYRQVAFFENGSQLKLVGSHFSYGGS